MTQDHHDTTPIDPRPRTPGGVGALPPERPDQIGPYRILELIGEGGFGQVYAAQQTEPVRRRVAVKVLKAGMDSKAVLARFAAERQALALMDHPGIARVLDIGETEAGRPYFVMDLIQGVPITVYCDRQRLTTGERLELFIAVCRAIQHAHTKGIVHRDVKPSNVLVATQDGKPVPKVIDFGIAKAMAGSLTDQTLHTLQGQLVGTPAYMSPEQSERTGLHIDTRTDVYSLGVLLYELLTGALPFAPSELREAGLDGLHRIIRDQEAPRPSTRISTLGDDSVVVAVKRRTEPFALRKRIRGELDWITMKAIEKDPARRYTTADALAEDVRRHLDSQPILARPPSRAYAFGKFVRRNRVLVGGIAATALALVAGIVVSARLAVREAKQRNVAVAARNHLQTVADFQARMLADVDAERMGRELFADIAERLHEDPATDPGAASIAASRIRDLNATDVALGVLDRSLLDRAETAVETEFADQPDVRAQLEHSLGRTAFALGLYERADRLLTRAAETYERTGADSGAVAARLDVGRTALFAGDWDRAETEIRAATAASGRSPDAGGLLALQGGLLMGLLRMERHEWAAAETTFAAARGTARGMLGPDHEVTISADEGWAHALTFLERFDEAAELYGELVPRARTVLGAGSPTTYQIIHNAAMCNSRMGRYDEALALYREDLEGSRSALGSEHSEVHVSTVNLGRLLVKIERWEEAEKMGREALRIAETNMPPGSVPRGMSHGLLAEALCGQQRYAEAEEHLRSAYSIFAEVFGPGSPGCQAMSRGMVDALSRLGRTEELAVWNERAGATR